MQAGSSPFGRELRQRRSQKGLSLQKFADLVNYSRAYIGKVETGDKPPTPELAHRCDEALEAGGTLIALAAAEGLPRLAQLPAAVATFVGREQQLRQLADTLTGPQLPGAPPVIAVDGPAGVGKTTLALRLAHQIKDRFPDGQLYVDLHAYSPDEQPAAPATVLEEFLVALGIQANAIPVDVRQRAALYRSLVDGRRILLVLDNALDSPQVEPLLPGSGDCAVVVTSRQRLTGLNMRQDQRLTLGPMTGQESMALLRMVIGAQRVNEQPTAVGELADRCGHLPLALRIAAERVATHPHHAVIELVEELQDEQHRLNALSTDDSVAVRTVFSWSYRDLSGEAARLFRLLGLHRGQHISRRAAAALAGMSPADARRLLDRLARVHLLEEIPGDRYRIHDLLRDYAAERALEEESEADRTAAIRRLVDWYLYSAYDANHALSPQRYDPPLDPPPALPMERFASYDDALAWCEWEMPNLVAATHMAIQIKEYTKAWKIPVGCWNYLFLRKRWSPWVSVHEVGLIGATQSGDRFGEAWTLNNLAHAYRELRRFGEAREHLERALRLRREIGDQIGEAWTLTALGFLDDDQRLHANAAEWFNETLRIRRAIAEKYADDEAIALANWHGEAIALANLGNSYRELGRFDEALDRLTEALDTFREINDRHGEAHAQVKIGDTHRDRGRHFQEALDAYQEALDIRRAIGDRWGEAETLHSRGQVLIDNGEAEAGRRCWREALAIFSELGDPRADDLRGQLGLTVVPSSA